MIRNLLDNALRYTPDGGTIEAILQAEPQGVRLSILDSGPGIPDTHMERVAERFHRASDATITGSGLGLSIVLALAHQQEVEVSLNNRESGGLNATLRWRQHASAAR